MQCVYFPHERHRVESGVSMAKQSFRDECDIGTIMKKYAKNGLLDHVNKFGGHYADLPESVEYQDAIHSVMEAEAAFASLTAEIRTKFGNDPKEFLAFVSDEDNAREIIALGLGPLPSSEPAPADPKPAAPVEGEDDPKAAAAAS